MSGRYVNVAKNGPWVRVIGNGAIRSGQPIMGVCGPENVRIGQFTPYVAVRKFSETPLNTSFFDMRWCPYGAHKY